MDTNSFIFLAGILLLISILASSFTVRFGLPLLLVFLGIGMLAGEDGLGRLGFDNPNLAFFVGNLALAVILLDGGMQTKASTFRVALWPSLSLATFGVILTAAAVGGFAAWLLDVKLIYGLLLGATVGSTDAAAVFSLLRNSGVKLNERVGGTLEIESGANDPMAILLVVMLTGVLQSSDSLSVWLFLGQMVQQFAIGGGLGLLGGKLLLLVLRRVPLIEGLYALLIISFGLAVFSGVNLIGGSGFLAVYLVGLTVGNGRIKHEESISQVMDGLAWLSQAGMFLLLGLLVTPSNLLTHGLQALAIATFLIFVARPLAVMLCLLPFGFRWSERFYISWVGLRGAVPIVLALYPVIAGLSNAALLFEITFTVVLISLLLQGSTVPVVARWLKVSVPPAPAPTTRFSLIENDAHHSLELYEFLVQTEGIRIPVSIVQNVPSVTVSTPQLVSLVREQRPIVVNAETVLKLGDRIWMLLHPDDVNDVAQIFSQQASSSFLLQNFFGEFAIRGDASLVDLAKAYGVPLEGLSTDDTASDLLQRKLGKHLVVGDRVRFGNIRLTIRQMHGDQIEIIGLKLQDKQV
ncbi:potassium/proton antiporter [Marinomonas hwangdonensis]|uniref:Potassium/proton antiporter n=1 Tax=Marinomonas hwangdonensis TaxID=1053647 RepID=A0A3M8Q6C5_9GAMM|nr:potassium/proton antiporter [Marinomonas hwangdonensis]MDP5056536.1 potassium/proton antiporter [Marinomonas hwangdonensis]RNF50480.1 potassium/proton antiporter [Marinomonas hwangdonensis]